MHSKFDGAGVKPSSLPPASVPSPRRHPVGARGDQIQSEPVARHPHQSPKPEGTRPSDALRQKNLEAASGLQENRVVEERKVPARNRIPRTAPENKPDPSHVPVVRTQIGPQKVEQPISPTVPGTQPTAKVPTRAKIQRRDQGVDTTKLDLDAARARFDQPK